MTKLAPAPKRRSTRLMIQTPLPLEAPDNLSQPTDEVAMQDVNFRVKADLHRQFKMEAAARSMSMRELFEASFICYIETYGARAAEAPPKPPK